MNVETYLRSHSLEFDRVRGALIGLAVGDALGTTLEFARRDTLPVHTQMTGGGPFGLQAGQWTDDTAMALALADSLFTCGTLDPADLMERFIAWWREGAYSCTGTCFDIGMTTVQALSSYEADGAVFAGSTDPRTAGNGSLMRLAPVAVFALDDPWAADRIARDQGRTTHGASEAVEACAYFVQILRAAILGEADVLRPRAWIGADCDPLFPRIWKSDERDHLTLHPEAEAPKVEAIAQGSWRARTRDRIRSSGYVIDTLEAALWAVGTTDSFEAALIKAVNLADDADTMGAVTGQLAGALYGLSAIPERWLSPLAWSAKIQTYADRLSLKRWPEA
ncbi:ADP-ribosylglycohydrolase family protein [Methylobacterium sp. WL12]|uniref:ADP-ribosylglycohydrolase family protein n=1 Tax=Methylobacterium sp. WL12 TaxID=2603890 RepID=UPI0011C71F8A|nr:ADP-ribosylglycohydrolase family protein [Methylobacterium sp. WL12]TXM64692.1 ADP-ribosylglycohydrolase family protein [Methylobacterium sp. WL12]